MGALSVNLMRTVMWEEEGGQEGMNELFRLWFVNSRIAPAVKEGMQRFCCLKLGW